MCEDIPSKRDEDRLFSTVNASLENERRLIAAGKLQRWDLTKWVVTTNGALAAASIALLKFGTDQTEPRWLYPALTSLGVLVFGMMAVLVSFVASGVMWHYSERRIGGSRKAARRFQQYLEDKFHIDVLQIGGHDKGQLPSNYDQEETSFFNRVVFLSAMPAVLVAAVWFVLEALMHPELLNTVGLVSNIVGVTLAFFFGYPQPSHDEGISMGIEPATRPENLGGKSVAEYNAEVRRRKGRYLLWSRAGLALMAIGFALQLAAVWLAPNSIAQHPATTAPSPATAPSKT